MRVSNYFILIGLIYQIDLCFAMMSSLGQKHMGKKKSYFEKKFGGLEKSSINTTNNQNKYIDSINKGAITPCIEGKAGLFPCKNMDLQSFLSISDQGSSSDAGSDIWGWVDPNTEKEYALQTFTSGMAIVDVTNPILPKPLFHFNRPAGSQASYWRDVKTYKNTAYLVADAASKHGLFIVDLERVRSFSGNGPKQAQADKILTNKFTTAHNIVINEDSGYAYVVGSNTCAGLLVYNLKSNRLNPSYVGCLKFKDSYVHDAECVNYNGPDSRFKGMEICFCYDEERLTIVDVTNKNNIRNLGSTTWPNFGYVHQGWLTTDGEYLIADDEGDERRREDKTKTIIVNVRNLRKPKYITKYVGPVKSIDHNLYTKGNYAYLTNYASGLRVVDIQKMINKDNTDAEVGFFDVYPISDTNNFDGAWSSYVYLPSGNILISSMEYGLFVTTGLKQTSPPITAPTPNPTPNPGNDNNYCKNKNKSDCESSDKFEYCKWGIPDGETTSRCYANCRKAKKKLCRKNKIESCEFIKIPGIRKKKCNEI